MFLYVCVKKIKFVYVSSGMQIRNYFPLVSEKRTRMSDHDVSVTQSAAILVPNKGAWAL